jgi:two-component system response regulator GlrR
MHHSPSPIALLVDFIPHSSEYEAFALVLESANIRFHAIDPRLHSIDKETLPRLCEQYHPSLIIRCMDQNLGTQSMSCSPSSITAPIIVVAQNFDASQIHDLLALGATDFITPPLTRENILPRIWRLIRHTTEASETRTRMHVNLAMQHLGLVGESEIFLNEIKKIHHLARCDISVLIGGETGTGKELVARAVHYLSPREDQPFVPIDCGAIPPELTESELFGHERGAFTGAVAKNQGLISAADHGTLFLDEVDALSLAVQAKLLRFLQEMEYRPLGSRETKKADVRVISATNRDLLELVRCNEFRQDLYYRLNAVQLRLPSLRQRWEDIVLLARHFVAKYVVRFNTPPREFSSDAIQKLLAYQWPGNIRELENVIGAAVALCDGPLISASDLLLNEDQPEMPTCFREAKARVITEFECRYIIRVLSSCGGNVSEAARAAGKNRRAFWELIRKHHIDVRTLRTVPLSTLSRKSNGRVQGLANG